MHKFRLNIKCLHLSFYLLALIAIGINQQVNAQAEVPNPTFPFWKVNGNSGTVNGTNFIGTNDNVRFNFRVNNIPSGFIDHINANYAYGLRTLNSVTTGRYLIALGDSAGLKNTSGASNIYIGRLAGVNSTLGSMNVLIGDSAGVSIVNSSKNTILGHKAGQEVFTFPDNTHIGYMAGHQTGNVGGQTFVGSGAGAYNTSFHTVALGNEAGFEGSGQGSVYVGHTAGRNNTGGEYNVMIGVGSGNNATNAAYNTLIGPFSGQFNTFGRYNSALGVYTVVANDNTTAIGSFAQATQSNSMVLGSVAGVNGANTNVKVAIGNNAPNTSLDVKGDFALRERVLTLANGINNNVPVDSNTFFRVSGPVSLFALTGLAGGVDGKVVTLFNNTSSTMYIDAMALSLPANQILTGAGDLLVADSGTVTLQYNSTIAKWVVTSYNNASYGATAWNLTGNAGTTAGTNFMGTIDNVDVVFKRNGFQAGLLGVNNTAWGDRALIANTTGFSNTALGAYSLTANQTGAFNVGVGLNALTQNSSGRNNVGVGTGAASGNTTGFSNVAVGVASLFSNTSRNNLVAVGDSALYNNGTGVFSIVEAVDNTAVGSKGLFSNTTGSHNTAIGFQSLYSNTSGWHNMAVGYRALFGNTIGAGNTASGGMALSGNSTGSSNTANGFFSLGSNTTGNGNTAMGEYAMFSNTTGGFNTASGFRALTNNTVGISNVGIGVGALHQNTTRSNLVAIGDSALFNNGTGAVGTVQASQNTAVGSKALFTNTIGDALTAVGFKSLTANTTGFNNVAVGMSALGSNTTGAQNVAVGNEALGLNQSASGNVAVGQRALYINRGANNTAMGLFAMANNNTGTENTAIGQLALQFSNTGSFNTALGASALYVNNSGSNNTSLGYYSGLGNTSGSNNTFVGFQAGRGNLSGGQNTIIGENANVLLDNLNIATAIGSAARVSASNTIILGDTVNRPQVGIGVTAVGKTLSGTQFEIASQGANDNLLYRYSGAQTPTFNFQRSLGTLAVPTAVVSGSTLGRLDFYGYDGANWDQAAVISAESDSAVSAGIVPSRIRFLTQSSGVGIIERMRINRNGNVIIGDGFDRNTLLYLDGGMTIEPYNLIVALTGDNQLVNVGNESYIRISSNTTVGTARTVYLSNGLEVGQLLIISSISTGTNQFELVDVNTDPASNTETGAASLLMDPKDTATFIWDGADWLMLSFRSNN